MSVNWDDLAHWGDPATCVTIAITDDLGDHGRGCDEAVQQ
jgi:hypothetical protein